MPFDLVSVKASFFDKKAVADKIDPAVRKALSRFGAFVRRAAKSSIKYGDKAAPPGKPPTAHRSKSFTRKKKDRKTKAVVQQPASPLRELILFGYDARAKSVVIGPTLGGSESGAPENLEYGGLAKLKGKVVRVRPHPFMTPAFATELKKVGNDFKNLIK